MLTLHLPMMFVGLMVGPVPIPVAEAFAAPRIIVLHGGPLERPVYLTNWHENLRFMGATQHFSGLQRASLDTVGMIQVAMFWSGQDWGWFAGDTNRLPELMRRLNEAQRGTIFLPTPSRPALLDYQSGMAAAGLRTISPLGLAILHRMSIPMPAVSDSTLVAAAIGSFHEALASGDSTGALSWLASDVVILEAGTRETRQEYRDHHLGADMQYAQSTRTTRGPINVTVSGDAAWAESTSENTRTVEGRTTRTSGAELMVLSRTAQGWRIRAIHWSSRTRRAEG